MLLHVPTTPPWFLTHPVVNFTLHCSDKSYTSSKMLKHRFYELCHEFKNYYRIITACSKDDNRVAAAVVHRENTKCVLLPDTAGIFRVQLYALFLAIDVVRCSEEKNCNFFRFHVKYAVCQRLYSWLRSRSKISEDYTILGKHGKTLFSIGSQVMWASSVIKKLMQLQSQHSLYLSLRWRFLPQTCILV